MAAEKPSQTTSTTNPEPPSSQETSQSSQGLPALSKPRLSKLKWKSRLARQVEAVNKELWLILSLFFIMGTINYLVTSHRMMLGLYTLPTLFSAYFYGRRHATLTAFASVFLVGLVAYHNPALFSIPEEFESGGPMV